jgi:hypothetical protein
MVLVATAEEARDARALHGGEMHPCRINWVSQDGCG